MYDPLCAGFYLTPSVELATTQFTLCSASEHNLMSNPRHLDSFKGGMARWSPNSWYETAMKPLDASQSLLFSQYARCVRPTRRPRLPEPIDRIVSSKEPMSAI